MTTAFNNATDFRRSLEARLKNLASKNNQDLQRIRRKVAFERLLLFCIIYLCYKFRYEIFAL
ncbi:MAG: hypothetical protein KR126chlam3_00008 [Chlamydiae bacterium]|nr:hypothetical protein [Chlamydiota bacterium]